MIRLSARLEASSHYLGHSVRKDGARDSPVNQGCPDEGGVWLNGLRNVASSVFGYPNNSAAGQGSTGSGPLLDDTDDFELPKRKGKRKVEEKKGSTSFAHSGMFDALSSTQPKAPPEQATTSLGTSAVMMPHWASKFWKIYGNKLRINGTVEGVCDLAIYEAD